MTIKSTLFQDTHKHFQPARHQKEDICRRLRQISAPKDQLEKTCLDSEHMHLQTCHFSENYILEKKKGCIVFVCLSFTLSLSLSLYIYIYSRRPAVVWGSSMPKVARQAMRKRQSIHHCTIATRNARSLWAHVSSETIQFVFSLATGHDITVLTETRRTGARFAFLKDLLWRNSSSTRVASISTKAGLPLS